MAHSQTTHNGTILFCDRVHTNGEEKESMGKIFRAFTITGFNPVHLTDPAMVLGVVEKEKPLLTFFGISKMDSEMAKLANRVARESTAGVVVLSRLHHNDPYFSATMPDVDVRAPGYTTIWTGPVRTLGGLPAYLTAIHSLAQARRQSYTS